MSKLTWGDKTLDFAAKLDKLEVASRRDNVQSTREYTSPGESRFENLLAISPDAAILDSWGPIEMMLDELNDEHYVNQDRPRTLSKTIEGLKQKEILSKEVAYMLGELRKLRNIAAHQGGLTPADAYRFRHLVDAMTDALEQHLESRPPSHPAGRSP
ncbi:MAG: DUF4145 domain-containing protein [Phenylobacterium sp.]|uniref:DUF4145 domain-containing protein n=1 Tax=Phenylobacterium sp. TaxID=1871053 RepID=UPI0025DBE26A|nr:DUF4145 domain-containing protein [Phenylobacterium sp.]MCG9917216.1 DUF4145 domain-containing protein [Phenylobacterium sp.]